MAEVNDNFWSEDISVLFRTDRLLEFFITQDQSISERLNSITRFGIYSSIVLSLYHNNPKYMLLSILVFIITYFIYWGNVSSLDDTQENFVDPTNPIDPTKITEVNGKKYIKSTVNNPFGNRLPFDPPNRPEMIDYVSYNDTALKAKAEVEKNFDINLFEDVDDVYSKQWSSRAFVTNPDRGDITRSYEDFKQWNYGGIKSCKENNYNCGNLVYDNLKNKKKTFPTPLAFKRI